MENKLTIIVPTFNNHKDLEVTLDSIIEFTNLFDLIIIDSSSYYPLNFKFKNEIYKFSKWVKPSGVYNAINTGVQLTKTKYLMTLNSGDTAESDKLINVINTYLIQDSFQVIIGCQNVSYKNINYIFRPSLKSLWPHQSVVYRKNLHDKIGLFNTNYKIISDQLFFEKIKIQKEIKIKFLNYSLTTYDVTGISSLMNLENIKEYEILNSVRKKKNFKLYFRYYFYRLCSLMKIDFNIVWHYIKSITITKI